MIVRCPHCGMGLVNHWHEKTGAVVPAREVSGQGGIIVAQGSVKATDNVMVYMCKKKNLPFSVKIEKAKVYRPPWWSSRDFGRWT